MADRYVPYTLPPCPEPPAEPTEPACPEWAICLPFGGRLYSRNGCVYAEAGNPPADGVYGRLVVRNGCIAGVEPLEAVVDVVAPCAENPEPCSGSGSMEPSKSKGNLYALDAAGFPLVRCSVLGGAGINVTGDGTASNPFLVTAVPQTAPAVYIKSLNDAIAVTGSGTYNAPFALKHKAGKDGKYNGMTFDAYGHLIDTGEGSANAGVTAVTGADGIDAVTDSKTGAVTVKLAAPTKNKNGTYHIGGFAVDLDQYNRIFDVTREITIQDGVYAFGAYDVSVTPTGSIEELGLNANGLGSSYLFNWEEGVAAKKRTATFTLRFATGLSGILHTRGSLDFWKGLTIRIDNQTAIFPAVTEEPAPASLAFWNFALFGAGSHTLTITAKTPWAEDAGAVVQLFALSAPDALDEEE